MKRILIALFAVLALAFANPAATSADKPDNPGQSQEHKKSDKGSDCRKKGCGQPHGQSCKHPNVHKTWCKGGRDHDGDDDGDGESDKSGGRLANTGA